MADEIIDFYKKAKEPEEPQKPIEEQKETPVPEIPKPDEPFDRFLLELAEKLQKEKVITEKQQETFVEQIKEPVSTDPNENDPFKKFIGSFANIIKQDELVNREENIKEATINFINKLKEQPEKPFIIDEQPLVVTKKKYLPPKIKQKIQKLTQEPPIKEKSVEVVKQVDEVVEEKPKQDNKYVQELKTADRSRKKIPEKIEKLSDIKAVVTEQVTEQFNKLRQMYPNFMPHGGGGGGTNAVQYALGGTMDGDLNVTGKYLSGGVDISTLFGSGGGGEADRLISGSSFLVLNSDGSVSFPNNFIVPPDGEILNIESETNTSELSGFTRISLSPFGFFAYDNNNNSISFSSADNDVVISSQDQYEWKFNSEGIFEGPNNTLTVNGLSSLGPILSGGRDLADIFSSLTGVGVPQTLSFNESAFELTISDGNTISLSSIVVSFQQPLSVVVTNLSELTSLGGGTGTGREDVNTLVIENSGVWLKDKYLVSTNFDAQRGYSYLVDTTTGTVTATLPVAPLTGHTIHFKDPYLTWNTNNFILNNNTNMIQGSMDSIACDVNGLGFSLTYVGSNVGWRIE